MLSYNVSDSPVSFGERLTAVVAWKFQAYICISCSKHVGKGQPFCYIFARLIYENCRAASLSVLSATKNSAYCGGIHFTTLFVSWSQDLEDYICSKVYIWTRNWYSEYFAASGILFQNNRHLKFSISSATDHSMINKRALK